MVAELQRERADTQAKSRRGRVMGKQLVNSEASSELLTDPG